MEKPRILLTRGRLPARAYADRLREAGAEPIEIGAGDAVPERIDGLCLSGGPDVDPERYGEGRRGAEEPDGPRDALELARLLPLAIRERIPVLAICRGLQVLNVHRGGTLMQDVGEAHRAKGDEVILHRVSVDPSSRLAAACGTSLVVNSRHHQVLGRLGDGLRPTAWVDGWVESAELAGDTWVVGVQWHPERTQDGLDESAERIFQAFVREAERVPAR